MFAALLAKLKEPAISVIPVMTIVVLLHCTLAPLGPGQLPRFLLGGLLLILGLAIFLIGADLGMVSFGQRAGSALTHRRSLALILVAVLAIGFAITIAEPDVQVLARQVNLVNPSIDRQNLLLMIAAGVGGFLMLGVLKTLLLLPLRWLLIGFYLLVFLLCSFVDSTFVGVAFDAGGATTGPITVPFIIAMGIGVASSAKKKEGDDSSFGWVGLASIGPISAVALMGMLSPAAVAENSGSVPPAVSAVAASPESVLRIFKDFAHLMPEVVHDILLALLPIFVIFLIFQGLLLRLPVRQFRRMVFGFAYAFIGLTLFMTGVSGGFSPAGQSLGLALGASGGWLLIPMGVVLGAVVVCAEPAVWVLTEQVEELSGGSIRRSIMLAALSVSVACAVALGMIRVVTGISIWYMLIPGYALALGLTFVCPRLFTAIAFDSGGVASGPMSATFVLSLALGASVAVGGNPATDAFGMISMIAMAPLISIQLLGLLFRYKEKKAKGKR